mgnify:CR=1 FL=1
MFCFKIIDSYKLNYDKSVLIVIDMIKGFTEVGNLSCSSIKKIAKDIRNECDKFSNLVAINDSHDKKDCEFNLYPEHCLEGSYESEFCDELLDVEFTHIINKNSTNGFFASKFFEVFEEYINNDFNFVVSGCCTDICILQFCLTFKGYLNSINKNLEIFIPINLIETYEREKDYKEKVVNASMYLMSNMGIKLVKSLI